MVVRLAKVAPSLELVSTTYFSRGGDVTSHASSPTKLLGTVLEVDCLFCFSMNTSHL